ncbi:hypothetical protein ABZZ80_33255 [Streptomyces sp. NPDC006356]
MGVGRAGNSDLVDILDLEVDSHTAMITRALARRGSPSHAACCPSSGPSAPRPRDWRRSSWRRQRCNSATAYRRV